jgi:hypothetical protein
MKMNPTLSGHHIVTSFPYDLHGYDVFKASILLSEKKDSWANMQLKISALPTTEKRNLRRVPKCTANTRKHTVKTPLCMTLCKDDTAKIASSKNLCRVSFHGYTAKNVCRVYWWGTDQRKVTSVSIPSDGTLSSSSVKKKVYGKARSTDVLPRCSFFAEYLLRGNTAKSGKGHVDKTLPILLWSPFPGSVIFSVPLGLHWICKVLDKTHSATGPIPLGVVLTNLLLCRI